MANCFGMICMLGPCIAGVMKVVDGDTSFGLLLIGFSLSMVAHFGRNHLGRKQQGIRIRSHCNARIPGRRFWMDSLTPDSHCGHARIMHVNASFEEPACEHRSQW